MSNAPDNLASLRREIDSIDEKLHDLLMRRAEIVGEVGRQKASAGGPTFRPAREAQLLRRLLARHSGALPSSVIVRLWREIVAASTRLQGDFSLAYSPNEDHGGALRLTQSQFGLDANVNRLASPDQVVLAVGRGDATVGIVPLADGSDGPDWWAGPNLPDSVFVVARLPWFADGAQAETGAYVLGATTPEESGDDRSVFTFTSANDVSRGKLAEMAAANGLEIGEQAVCDRDDVAGRVHLVDVKGFLTDADPRVRGIASLLDGAELRWLGSYAAPYAGQATEDTE